VERATRHFEDPDVACVAGSLKVRNIRKSLVTRLQAIEYFFSIQASKTGLSAFNMVNNISGAFGVFRKDVLKAVMGWSTGSAEDLDLTLRVKNYFGRYKNMKIVFDPEAVGLTDVPETFRDFFRQRLRWDGDLSYIYFRKHWMSFNPRLVGWKNFIALLWTGLLFQIVMPFAITGYLTYLAVAFPVSFALGIMALVYLFYLSVTAFFLHYLRAGIVRKALAGHEALSVDSLYAPVLHDKPSPQRIFHPMGDLRQSPPGYVHGSLVGNKKTGKNRRNIKNPLRDLVFVFGVFDLFL